jgi:tRNA(Ile)-lysidine synthase TilS/MesJ
MTLCQRCVLPETFPGSNLDPGGLCAFCRARPAGTDDGAIRKRTRDRFERLVGQVRGGPGHGCLLAYSGGKDSTYTLLLLRRHYGLRVLAVTFDNGFLSPAAFNNARRVMEVLDVEHLIVKPRFGLMRKLFSAVAVENPFPAKAISRASPVCNVCMGLAKGIFLRLAIERRIPLLAYGWSPGQAPPRAGFFRLNAAMIREMQESRLAPLAAIAGDELGDYLLEEPFLASAPGFPYSVNPLSFFEYDEQKILAAIAGLGWKPPADTDGNSTNCLLNLLAARLHLRQFGFHPYAFEIAGMVRDGFMSRAEGLAKLEDLGSREQAEAVAGQLGLPAGLLS